MGASDAEDGAGFTRAVAEVMLDRGLLSVVAADAALIVTEWRGKSAPDGVIGTDLTEALPVLTGCGPDLLALKETPGERFVLANVASRDHHGVGVRNDYAVVFEPRRRIFLVLITPTHAFDNIVVEREQSLRDNYRLKAQIADQAAAIETANEALRRTNADLASFTRRISHDLKAPMRALRYAAEDIEASLANDDAGVIQVSQRDSLDELRQQSQRLSHMVTDLLAYSTLDDKTDAEKMVDTRELVGTIVRSLPRKAGLDVRISGTWPTAKTARAPLDLVLRNLIDNAIKFHRSPTGLIELMANVTPRALEIEVIDDGPGIPAKYRSAVLKPFVKVDPDQTASSGLGLSMVAKQLAAAAGDIQITERQDCKRGTRIKIVWPLTSNTD